MSLKTFSCTLLWIGLCHQLVFSGPFVVVDDKTLDIPLFGPIGYQELLLQEYTPARTSHCYYFGYLVFIELPISEETLIASTLAFYMVLGGVQINRTLQAKRKRPSLAG